MKKILFTLFTLSIIVVHAQVGIGTTTPDSSAILELESTTQGVLTPRMTQSQRDAIGTPAEGLLVYQTDNTPGFYYYNGSVWYPFVGVDNDWTVSGNDMYNANTGNVGVGNTAPTAKLHITGTASGGSGGTATILSQDFESATLGFVTGTVSTNEYQITAPGGSEVWRIVDASTDYVTVKCSSCTGQWAEMEYENIDQDETFVSSQFTPSGTATSLDITFDYMYKEFLGNPDESLSAYLYNDTDGAIASTLFSHNDVGDQDLSYSGSFTFSGGNTATDSYTLRFRYTGSNDYGASVDNIIVDENTAAAPSSSVFRLEDGTQQNGYVLTSDANGNATWQVASGGGTDSQTLSISGNDLTISGGNTVTLPSSGGGSVTADNGLNISSGSNVQLGGALTLNTFIELGTRSIFFEGNSTGDFIIEGNNNNIMTTNSNEDYVNFGAGSAFKDSDDGQTFVDTFGTLGVDDFTKTFVLGAYKGSSGGTAIALGSIEYVVDGTSELFYQGGAISPMSNLGADLGADPFTGTTRIWDDVHADDFITPTNTYSKLSGKSKEITNEKGLAAILRLKPIIYKENDKIGNTTIPENLKVNKLGFDVNELLSVIPEAVKTSDWVTLSEKDEYKTYVEYKNPKGIMYNQIIPVTVKAIQEQQNQIKELKAMVLLLKKEIEVLKN